MDSLTVDRGRRAGFAFLHKMLQCVSQHAVLLRSLLITITLPSQAGKSQEPHNILRHGSQHRPRGILERIPELPSGRDAYAPLLAKLGCKYPQEPQIHS